MPWKPKKPCVYPGCPSLTDGRYCKKHKTEERKSVADSNRHYNRNVRDRDAQRFYESAEWKKVRALKLKQSPVCERCYREGRIVKAEIVHHKDEISQGGARLDVETLESLCRRCHNKIHKST